MPAPRGEWAVTTSELRDATATLQGMIGLRQEPLALLGTSDPSGRPFVNADDSYRTTETREKLRKRIERGR